MAPSLPTRKLGKNGPEVTALGFGTMGLSAFYGKPKPDEERYALLDHICDKGVRFWDSSDMYGDSEDLLGRWFKRTGKRQEIFLATKFGNYVDPDTGVRGARNDPEYARQACDRSLKRLGIDQIDLYYAHRLDKDVPIEVTVGGMKALQDAGKVKYLGLSECSADTLRRACKVSRWRNSCQTESTRSLDRSFTSMPSSWNTARSPSTLRKTASWMPVVNWGSRWSPTRPSVEDF
jgi:aryl-alcohol dehydrogenase-like predicted oxidoreductase